MTHGTKSKSVSQKPVQSNDDGWEDIGVRGPQSWHVCEPGNTVQGKLLSREYRKGNENRKGKYFYRIELTAPTRVVRKEEMDEPAIERMAQAREVVCVDERKALEDLRILCEDGGKYLVRLTPVEKVEIGGGQSFWQWKSQKRVLSPPTRTVKPDDSDIPF